MTQQPGQQMGTSGEQYGGQVGRQGTQEIGQGGQQFGQGSQQFGQGGQQGMAHQGQAMDIKLEEGLSDEMRVVLHDLVQSTTACEWCAERCIDEGPGMAECIRLCRDVADIATLNVQLMARDSIFGPEAIQVFADAAEACAQECARHGHRHCQECAEVLTRAVQSTRKMLASFGQGGGQAQGGQMQAGQMQGGGMQPQSGQMQAQGQEFQGGSFGQSQAPGQQTQLPIEAGGGFQGGQEYQQPQDQGFQQTGGGSFGQPQGQQFGQGQQSGQHYSEGQPSGDQSGAQGQPPGRQF